MSRQAKVWRLFGLRSIPLLRKSGLRCAVSPRVAAAKQSKEWQRPASAPGFLFDPSGIVGV